MIKYRLDVGAMIRKRQENDKIRMQVQNPLGKVFYKEDSSIWNQVATNCTYEFRLMCSGGICGTLEMQLRPIRKQVMSQVKASIHEMKVANRPKTNKDRRLS